MRENYLGIKSFDVFVISNGWPHNYNIFMIIELFYMSYLGNKATRNMKEDS